MKKKERCEHVCPVCGREKEVVVRVEIHERIVYRDRYIYPTYPQYPYTYTFGSGNTSATWTNTSGNLSVN